MDETIEIPGDQGHSDENIAHVAKREQLPRRKKFRKKHTKTNSPKKQYKKQKSISRSLMDTLLIYSLITLCFVLIFAIVSLVKRDDIIITTIVSFIFLFGVRQSLLGKGVMLGRKTRSKKRRIPLSWYYTIPIAFAFVCGILFLIRDYKWPGIIVLASTITFHIFIFERFYFGKNKEFMIKKERD